MGSSETVSPLDAPPSSVSEPELLELLDAPPRLTMTVTMLEESPLETMMEVEPVPTAVTVPLPETVATLLSLERKVRPWGAVEGVTLPVIWAVSPGLRTR